MNYRTKYCGKVSLKNVGENITLCGWVQKQRDLGKLIFVDLRDRTGIVQLAFYKEENEKVFKEAFSLRSEFVISVSGIVLERSSKNFNIPTGEIEIKVKSLKILAKSEVTPFEITENSNAGEELRLKYRYLDLRRKDIFKNIIFRYKVTKLTRDYFDKNNFIEIETPILIKSTPEGARDYLVPSRIFKGKFFALPQSAQLYKQLTMIAGFDRYIQIAKCFRDEDLRANRQPEFTQIDIEISFVEQLDIMNIVENFMKKLYKDLFSIELDKIPMMTYDQCIKDFGSDKPDLRFDMKLVHLNELKNTEFEIFKNAAGICAINAENSAEKFSRKQIDKLNEWIKASYNVKCIFFTKLNKDSSINSSFEKYLNEDQINLTRKKANMKPGDILFLLANENKNALFESAGALRLKIAKKIDIIDKKQHRLLWVTNFPLFEYDKNKSRFIAKHHPFTSPEDESLSFLEKTPEKARAKAYDLVLNGHEIGGGSIRINNVNLQKKIFKILGFNDEEIQKRFGFLIEAMKYGTPPHGGFAFGLDRLIMVLLNLDSIREVIAFPKISNSCELMTSSPNEALKDQLLELGITISL